MVLGKVLFLVSCLFLVACDKAKVKSLSGSYECDVKISSYSFNQFYDSSYNETLVVEPNKKSLNIFGESIPVDSVRSENFYKVGNHKKYFTIQFKNDSVFL